MFNFNIIIIESVIYIIVSILIGFILRNEELKSIKRLILIFYLIIGIAVYSILYFIILSIAALSAAMLILKFYD